MFKKSKKAVITGFSLAIVGGAIIGSHFLEAKEGKLSQETKLEAYIKFTKILNLIESQYVDETNTTALIDKALKGLMQNLDPHSAFLTAKDFKDLNIQN